MKKPKVAVLLAAFNGRSWIKEQVDSILNQQGVDLTLFISVDFSTDGTYVLLEEMASSDSRIILLEYGQRFGGAGANFFRLIQDVRLSEFDYIAFSDQDDVWFSNKLLRQTKLIESQQAEAISSNVVAFWQDGSTKLIVKSQPQKTFDFIFESAGQGCTYLMTSWLVNQIKLRLEVDPAAKQVEMHDWLSYAICRAYGKRWILDDEALVRYRQHPENVFGVNVGLKAILARIRKIRSGWYRQQVQLISSVASKISRDESLMKLDHLLHGRSFLSQLRLVPFAMMGRRNFHERLFLVLTVILFIF